MAGRKKRKDYADKVSKKKAVKARFDDKFGNPIKKLDDLILSLKPKKKMKSLDYQLEKYHHQVVRW